MSAPALIWLIVFCYIPMSGLQIAFKDYKLRRGIWGSDFVGLKHFRDFVADPLIGDILLNTICISILKIISFAVIPVFFAIVLNEAKSLRFKKVVQTATTFPYFISWTIIAVMAVNWLDTQTGFINSFLVTSGVVKEGVFFLGRANLFWGISVVLDLWKTTGWLAVIYFAAITAIDAQLYEAAAIDGAGRLRRILYITLPSLRPTFIAMLIINLGAIFAGGLFSSNFSISYLLGNPLNSIRSSILDTYVLKTGLELGKYSYATAVGLFSSVVSVAMLLFSNFACKKIFKESLF